MENEQQRQRGPDQRPQQGRGPATDPRQGQPGQGQRPPNGGGGNGRQTNQTQQHQRPSQQTQQRPPHERGPEDRRPADDRGPAARPDSRGDNRPDSRAPVSRDDRGRYPEDRGGDGRGRDSGGYDNRGQDDRGYDDRRYENERGGPAGDGQEGGALATRDDGGPSRGLAPTTQGTVGSISPREQRNFIALVSGKSAAARRGESQPGLYHSRNLGSFQTVTAEVVGCFYRQRYHEWDERAQIFHTYCEAAAPTIELLFGNGQPGGRCTECGLTKWREVRVEGTDRTKNQPPLCGENVVFDLFIHEVAARAFWEVSSTDNLDTIRNTINILNNRFGWGQYVIQLYSTMQMNSRNEERYTPHVRHRPDLQAFNQANVIDGSGQVVTGAAGELTDGREYDPAEGPPPYHYPVDDDPPDAGDHWQDAEEEDLPF